MCDDPTRETASRILPGRRAGPQCRLLHRLQGRVVVALMAAASTRAGAAPTVGDGGPPAPDATAADPLREPLLMSEREALAGRIRARTLAVTRLGAPDPRSSVPGPGEIGGGAWVAPDRVITASALVLGWPRHGADHLTVSAPDGRALEAAVGLLDARLGLAVLDVPGLGAPPEDDRGWAPPEEAVRSTVALFGTPAPQRHLWRAVVSLRGTGQRGYYWWVQGDAPLGTPLFDARGRLVSLIGLATPEVPLRGLALPAVALRGLMERRVEWWP